MSLSICAAYRFPIGSTGYEYKTLPRGMVSLVSSVHVVGQKKLFLSVPTILILPDTAKYKSVNELVAQLPSGRAVAKTNISLSDLPSHIATADLFVGHGTGVSHLAAVLGVPTIALLAGVSPLDVWHPVGPRTVVLTNHVPCSPCGFKYPRQCAFDVKCLSEISTRDVLKAIGNLIGEPSSAVGARPLGGLSQWQEVARRAGQQVVQGAVSA